MFDAYGNCQCPAEDDPLSRKGDSVRTSSNIDTRPQIDD